MNDINKFLLKGMICELREYLKENNFDDIKKICKKISDKIDEINSNEVSTDIVSSNKEDTKQDNNNEHDAKTMAFIAKTMAFIELLLTNNQKELFKLYEDDNWMYKLNFELIYKHIKYVENKNPNIYHMLGYIYTHGCIFPKNVKKANDYYLKCWEDHMYASYNLYRNTQQLKHLEKSAKLGFVRAQYEFGDICADRQTAIKFYIMSAKQGNQDAIARLGNQDLVSYLLKNDY